MDIEDAAYNAVNALEDLLSELTEEEDEYDAEGNRVIVGETHLPGHDEVKQALETVKKIYNQYKIPDDDAPEVIGYSKTRR